MPYKNTTTQAGPSQAGRGKQRSILLLAIIAGLIFVSGLGYSLYSLVTDSKFLVLGNEMPGVFFGIMITFLGLRYGLAVRKLHIQLSQTTESFSWSNFRQPKIQHKKIRQH